MNVAVRFGCPVSREMNGSAPASKDTLTKPMDGESGFPSTGGDRSVVDPLANRIIAFGKSGSCVPLVLWEGIRGGLGGSRVGGDGKDPIEDIIKGFSICLQLL